MKNAYINGIILSGEKDMVPVEGMVIFTENGRISAIEKQGVSTEGWEVIDLNGSYICPVLSICMCIFPAPASPKRSRAM